MENVSFNGYKSILDELRLLTHTIDRLKHFFVSFCHCHFAFAPITYILEKHIMGMFVPGHQYVKAELARNLRSCGKNISVKIT